MRVRHSWVVKGGHMGTRIGILGCLVLWVARPMSSLLLAAGGDCPAVTSALHRPEALRDDLDDVSNGNDSGLGRYRSWCRASVRGPVRDADGGYPSCSSPCCLLTPWATARERGRWRD